MQLRVLSQADQARHDPGPGAADRPDRVEACAEALSEAGFDVHALEGREATLEELSRVHAPEYLSWLAGFCADGGGRIDADTAAGPHSYEVARRAAAMTADAALSALDGVRSLCLTRPPGHHATRREAMGFCLINHVAVAAAAALDRGAQRVAVVDFDVHHGNGTQDIFYEDPALLYISTHQWPWYPWRWGAVDETGLGEGEGYNVNLPLPAMSGDPVYLAVMQRLVHPILEQFEPDLILVSAGFDAHRDDPLSLMEVSTDGFGLIMAGLVAVAERVCAGRLAACLEGGYSRPALASSVVECARALTGRTKLASASGLLEGLPLNDRVVRQLIEHHAGVWELGFSGLS